MKMELDKDLWNEVDGSELEPSTLGTRKIAWENKDGQTRASILLNVKYSTLQHISPS
jgi:hypothetical protein